MRKPNRHAEKIQMRQREKRNESRRKNSKISKEVLNHRANVVEKKSIELANRYIEELTRQFNIKHGR